MAKRPTIIPYGHQWIDEKDIKEVVKVLKSDWLTQGPKVETFEKAVAKYCGAKYGVAVSSGTAGLHSAFVAAGINTGDEIITTPLTFAATANTMVFCQAKPIFVDVEADTLNINPEFVEGLITKKTKAIVPVDFAGHPAEYDKILKIAKKHNLLVIEDACHALGAEYKNKKIGSLADMTVLSFHPVKHITSVTYDTPVLIKIDGITKLVRIGQLMDFMINSYWEPDGYECLAFNRNGKISWQKVKAFIKHDTHTEILKINLEKGREVEITKSHSVFTIKNNKVKEILGRNLKIGDYLIVPRKLPIPNSLIQEIDVLNYIKRDNIKYNQKKIILKSNKQGGGGGKPINRKIKINEELCKLLGYFVAEGSYNLDKIGGGLRFTFGLHEKNTFVKEVKKIFRSIWPNFRVNIIQDKKNHKCTVLCGGLLHSDLFKNIACGKNVYDKGIPDIIWETNDKNKLSFIEGLINGDGHERIINGSRSRKLKVASENLANGLHYLLLTLGIQSRLEKEKYYSKKGKLCYSYVCEILGFDKQITAKENSIPVEFLSLNNKSSWHQKNRIRHKKSISIKTLKSWLNNQEINCPKFLLEDIAVLKIKKIGKRILHDFVYDFEVKGLQNFIGGYGAICLHNTGEGGMALTNNKDFYEKLKVFRHHGIIKKPQKGKWYYEIENPGFNYRLTDFQCALGLSQLKKIDKFIKRRREIVEKYNKAFSKIKEIIIPIEKEYARSSWHIYPVQLKTGDRRKVFDALQKQGIGCQVHYMPLHLHPFYRNKFGYKRGDFPEAEKYYERAITLPLFPKMTEKDIGKVIKIFKKVISN